MKLEIEGLLRGRDMGYSVRHPDHNHLDEFCCCEERHCHLPGETPKERHHYASLMIAALEMFELLAEIRDQHLIPRCGMDDCTDCDDKIFAARIDALLAKIEGGGK